MKTDTSFFRKCQSSFSAPQGHPNVAWGNAPGKQQNNSALKGVPIESTTGAIHDKYARGERTSLDKAFSLHSCFIPIPGALPQATLECAFGAVTPAHPNIGLTP